MDSACNRNVQGIVALANDMLSKLHLPTRVHHWSEVNAGLFLIIMEGLMAESLPDVIQPARSREDDVHNVQVVIDTLSLDILNTSMTHITGESVVDGDQQAIANLLDVLCGLMEFLLDKIGSDISSTDNDDDLTSIDDPDLVTPEVIDDILDRELRDNKLSGHFYPAEHPYPDIAHRMPNNENRSKNDAETTADLIALGQISGYENMKDNTGETTEQLIAFGHNSKLLPGKSDHSVGVSQYAEREMPSENRQNLSDRNHTFDLPTSEINHKNSQEFCDGLPVWELCEPQKYLENAGLRSSQLKMPQSTDSMPKVPAPVTNNYFTSDHTDMSKSAPPFTRDTGFSTVGELGAALDSSLASSSVAFPQPVVNNESRSEFASVGIPRSSSQPLSTGPHGVNSFATQSSSNKSDSKSNTYHLYHHFEKDTQTTARVPALSSLPVVSSIATSKDTSDRPTYTSSRTEAQVPNEADSLAGSHDRSSGTSPSYSNLENLMRNTVDMSRAAVISSPHRSLGPDQQPRPGLSSMDSLSKQLSHSTLDRSDLSRLRQEAEASEILSQMNRRTVDSSREKSVPEPAKPYISRRDTNDTKVTHPVSRTSTEQSSNHICHSQSQRQGILSPRQKTNVEKRKVSFQPKRSIGDRGKTSNVLYPIKDIHDAPLRSSLRKKLPSHQSYDVTEDKSRLPSTRKEMSAPHLHIPASRRMEKVNGLASRTEIKSPKNSSDYYKKYYSLDRLKSLSDSEMDYNPGSFNDADVSDIDSDSTAGFYNRHPAGGKSVRFEEFARPTAGPVDNIRRRLLHEQQRARIKAKYLGTEYEDGLGEVSENLNEEMDKHRYRSSKTEVEYRKKAVAPSKPSRSKTSRAQPVPTSSVLYGEPRSRSTTIRKRTGSRRKRSASASPSSGRSHSNQPPAELLPWLLEEFPYLHLSTETLHDMWRRSARQLQHLSKAEESIRHKKNNAQIQIKEAERKQNVILNIVKKEVAHSKRNREVKERQQQQHCMKAKLRERRQQSARARRYYDEYTLQMRSKMLKKRTKEELIFKKLFREGLDVQKERIRDLRKYAKEQRDRQVYKQRDELQSLENYYRDQFSMLSEKMSKEQEEIQLREHSQQQVLRKMKNGLRHKLEKEVKEIQEQLCRDDDDAYFREVDAQRLQRQLQMMRFTANV